MQRYKVLKGGWTVAPINPHEEYTDFHNNLIDQVNPEWMEFERNAEILLLTRQQDEGIEMEGELVWYVKEKDGYRDIKPEPERVDEAFVWDYTEKGIEDLRQKFQHLDFYLALQPITTNSKEEKPKWIEITKDNLPSQLLICQWKHPEYGIIKGNLVIYGPDKSTGYKQTFWVYPDPDPVSQADIALEEFTHYRKFPQKKKSPLPIAPASIETVEQAAVRRFKERLGSDKDGAYFIGFKDGADYSESQTTEQPLIELLEKEIERIEQLFQDSRLEHMFEAYKYSIFVLNGIKKQLT